mmetsp:Transcript_23685/g.68064  ORF Transcript_23685/g.68064 Transcript_23685/m.68064 type:complete len:332 (+) Transcript_23685:248-1243(+)
MRNARRAANPGLLPPWPGMEDMSETDAALWMQTMAPCPPALNPAFMPPAYGWPGIAAASDWRWQQDLALYYSLGRMCFEKGRADAEKGRADAKGRSRGGAKGERKVSGSKSFGSEKAAPTLSEKSDKAEKANQGETGGKSSSKTSKPAALVPMKVPVPHPAHEKPEMPENGTTCMLRNIPNRYTRIMLLNLLNDAGFHKAYDFVYMPMSFRNGVNLGYAFVDLVSHEDAKRLMEAFEGWSKWSFESTKVCKVSWATPHQGLEKHVDRYRNSPVMHPSTPEEWKPIVFKDGEPAPFPAATKAIRAPKLRPEHDRVPQHEREEPPETAVQSPP